MALRALQGPTGGGAPVGGTGTTNTIPRWTGPSTLGDSGLIDNGSDIYTSTRGFAIGDVTSAGWRLFIRGNNVSGSSFGARIDAGTTSADYSFRIRSQSGTEYLAVRGDGNVGIGTATPLSYANYVSLTIGDNNAAKTGLLKFRSTYNGGNGAEIFQSTAGVLAISANGSRSIMSAQNTGATDSAAQVAIGTSSFTSGRALTTVADLDVFGVRVGRGPGDIASNTAIGAGALSFCTTGSENTVLGQNAGFGISTGVRNVMIGAATGSGGTVTGSRNIVVGRQAGNQLTSGSDNVLLGTQAGDSITTGASNIVIGSSADLAAATDSNKLVIGDATNYVATNGGATTYYATAGALAGYIIVRLNGTDVKLPVYAL